MAAAASSPLCRSIPVVSRMPRTFICGSPLVISGGTHHHHHHQKVVTRKAMVRCEQSSSGGLDVWLGRTAMVGFAVAIGVEISTGKGLLENFGLTSPLPTVALAVTVLVGVLTAVFIFQSASSEN